MGEPSASKRLQEALPQVPRTPATTSADTASIINPIVISLEPALAPIVSQMYDASGLPVVTNYGTSNYAGIKISFKGGVV